MARKRKPGPLEGMYRVADLAKASNLSPRAIRGYVERKFLPPPRGRGPGLIYGELHMHKLVAMQRLRQEGGFLEDISAELDKLSPAELAAAAAGPAPAAAAAPGAAPPPLPGASERWDRVVIVPGLELHLWAGSGPLPRRLAQEILASYAARGPSGR